MIYTTDNFKALQQKNIKFTEESETNTIAAIANSNIKMKHIYNKYQSKMKHHQNPFDTSKWKHQGSKESKTDILGTLIQKNYLGMCQNSKRVIHLQSQNLWFQSDRIKIMKSLHEASFYRFVGVEREQGRERASF